jgi:hypothetical protein
MSNPGIGAYLLLGALSVHSVFAGIAIGLENHLASLINIVVGIVAHKWAASIAIGVALTKT